MISAPSKSELADTRLRTEIRSPSSFNYVAMLLAAAALFGLAPFAARSQDAGKNDEPEAKAAALQLRFQEHIRPLVQKFCVRCHNPDNLKSGVRVDHLDGSLEGRTVNLWKAIGEQLADEAMPPDDQPQPTPDERQLLAGWIDEAIAAARARKQPKNGSVRRLTVAQYRNTLRDLLGIDDDFSDLLPPDAVSKDGFLNNAHSMQLSPLLLEAYFNIAEQALDRAIVDEPSPPEIQNFRMDLGEKIKAQP